MASATALATPNMPGLLFWSQIAVPACALVQVDDEQAGNNDQQAKQLSGRIEAPSRQKGVVVCISTAHQL